MNRSLALVQYLHAALLRLYPRQFRDEFADEMLETFGQMSVEAAAQGKWTLVVVCWRELRLAPVNIVREHWRERSRRNMDKHPQESPGFETVSGLGMLAALTPFLGAALLDLGPMLGPVAGYVGFVVLGGMIVLLLLGLTRGVPSWCLPTVGLFATILALPALVVWAPVFFFLPPLGDWMRLVIGSGWPWFSLCVMSLIAVVVMAFTPRVPLLERMRRDWIWLAFALYGSAALWLWLTFDEYAGRQPYVVAASATLVVGALIYLNANHPWPRFWTLLGSLLLVVVIVAWGKWNLVPTQTWPLRIDEGLRWGELQSTLQSGAWLMLAVLGLPALFSLIPRRRGQSPSSPI
jgi:hypothetical protein